MQNKSEMINQIAELKEENAKLNAIIDGYQPRLQKYKDILQEIKEIAEDAYENESEYQATGVYNEIIQVITKAEEE